MRTLGERLRPHRVLVLGLFDGVAWCFAVACFAALRLDVVSHPVPWDRVVAVGVTAALLHTVLARFVRLHHGRATLGTLEEMTLLGGVTLTVGAITTLGNAAAADYWLPRSVPVAATFLALTVMASARAVYRRVREFPAKPRGEPPGTPALILGAGEAGRQLVDSMLRDGARTWRPVALLDDDLNKRYRRIRGVPVLGRSTDLDRVAQQTGCKTLIIAIPSASADLVRSISHRATAADMDVKVLPGVAELFHGRVGISDIRDIQVADLLGRHQIDTDVASIAGYLTGRRVLVTGAGGSIGSELCRQIHRYGPSELIMLDRDESALHAVQLSIQGRALLDSSDVALGDIRDRQFVQRLFAQRRPHVVFHAAALKHLPILEQYPGEAIKTNVWGSLHVLDAAKDAGVERFVNISTDKAANPCSVLGYSKRIAEGLTATVAQGAPGTYLSVRFGNVLGSRGSVLTSFAAQIEAGGPVTVTHPEVTRYFMTVQEAVELVIQAAAIGRRAEALVLDMGRPVRITDVAQGLIDMACSPARILYTGLRPGEKLHEELFSEHEEDRRPLHPLISHVEVSPVPTESVLLLDAWAPVECLVSSLKQLCNQMVPGRAPAVLTH